MSGCLEQVVYTVTRYLYWTDNGQTPKIVKANLDATNVTTIAEIGVRNPLGLTVDYQTHHLYWTDAFVDAIEVTYFS